jgi:hypothetical protein
MNRLLTPLFGYLSRITLFLASLLGPLNLLAQVPRDIPTDTGPLEVDSTFDIILYIVLPIIIIIFFFVYRSAKKKKDRERGQ